MGFNFTYVNSGAEITFDDNQDGAFASGVTSGNDIISAIINVDTDWLDDGSSLNSYAFETYLHEIGNALGLAHGGNYNGSAEYGIDNYYVNDSLAWSIMSYMQAEGDDITNTWNTYMNAAFQDMYTPMIADLIAVQYLYGTSAGTFAGNTTYGFGGTTGLAALDNAATRSGALMAMTVFDTGGIDTLDFSQTAASQVISLSSESLSSVLGGRHNVGIARGVVIENAISGSGDDLLVGNQAANQLFGGVGNDTLYGEGGGDTLYGGAGNDHYFIESIADKIFDESGTDRVAVTFSIDLTHPDFMNIENVCIRAETNETVTGSDGNNWIDIKGGGAILVSAGAGNDTLVAGIGDADIGARTLYGGLGDDELQGCPNGYLYGGAGNDILMAWSGRNVMYGGSEADLIFGWVGQDIVFGGDGDDTLSYAASHYAVNVNLATNQVRGGDAHGDVISEIEGVVGSKSADTLRGSTAHNYFDGFLGNDTIYGGAGNDTIAGNGGKDSLYGDAGRDSFLFNRLQDMTTSASTTDVIFGFARGQDKIDLSAIDAMTASIGSDDAFVFRGKGAFGTNPAGEVRFQQFNLSGTKNDYTLVYLDTDTDRTAEGVIKVMGLHNFTAGDFIL